jgi:prolyl-tRNA editing enzyme YbaK/EbsC (Cys-tRNA(Pro) deacylase)
MLLGVSVARVREHLAQFGREDAIRILDSSSATVELAAAAIGVDGAQIGKTVAVYDAAGSGAMLIVVAGDAKLSNGNFKRRFGFKPRMLRAEDVEPLTGHEIGGVCPFGNPDGVPVWLDESLRRFEWVWPAAGGTSAAVGLRLEELERFSGASGWVYVTTGWRDAEPEPKPAP